MAKKKKAAKPAAKKPTKPKTAKAASPATPPVGEPLMLAYRQLVASPLNPRKTFEPEALRELADSIASQGLLQNLVVRPFEALGAGNGQTKIVRTGEPLFEIGAGERRWRAIGFLVDGGAWDPAAPIIACRCLSADDAGFMAVALLENLQRKDVPPMEEAEAFAALRRLDPELWTTATIAERIGKTQRYVQQRLALAEKLDDKVKDALRQGDIDVTHARALTAANPKLQREAVDKIKAGHFGWSEPDRLNETVLKKLPLVAKAPFPLERYTGEIVEGPAPHGTRDGRRFADVEQFKALQKEIIDEKKQAMGGKWAWVEVRRGESYKAEPTYGDFKKSSDKKTAGAIIFVEADGGVVVKTGLVKVEKAAAQQERWEERSAREHKEREARGALEKTFIEAIAAGVAQRPALALQLLLADLLGAEILERNCRPTALTARFRDAFPKAVLRQPDEEDEDEGEERGARFADDADPQAAFAPLVAMTEPGLMDEDDRLKLLGDLLAALIAEHIDLGYGGLNPYFAHTARQLGVAIPEHLGGEHSSGDQSDEPDLAAGDDDVDAAEAAQ